jgi:RNA polymerase sigma factor (sigma-70 family)
MKMSFIKLSNVCDDPEDELFHDTAEQRAAHTAWDLATKELSGLPAIFGTHWTHKWLHQEIVGFLRTLSTEEAEAWDYDVRNALAREDAGVDDYDAFADVENWEDFVYDDFEAQEAAKICIAAAAYVVNSQPTSSPRESAAITPRRQTGGSNDDADSASSDGHDSHVLAPHRYNQHTARLICWTSALEAVSAVLPAAKTTQKHTHYIGNLRLELVDYPADFSPDYTPPTLLLAAKLHGYRGDFEQLYSLLDKNAACRTIFKKFSRPLTGDVIDNQVVQDTSPPLPDDLTMRMRILDPNRSWYTSAAVRMAQRLLAGWERDPMYDDMYDSAVNIGYTKALRGFNPQHYPSFGSYLYACIRTEIREAIKSTHMYETRAVISRRVADNLLPALLSICVDKCIDPAGTKQMIASVANYLTCTQDRVSYDAVKQMVADLRGRVPESRQHALLGDIEDAIVGMARGYRVVPTESLNINTDDHDADDRQYYLRDIKDDEACRFPAEVTERKDLSAAVEYLLGAIEDGLMRDVYISKHVHELKTGEISDLYGLTQDKVRNYLSKAQAILEQAAAAHDIRGEDYY